MTSTHRPNGLSKGLRALEKLAVLAPVEPPAFARSVGLDMVEAAQLLEAFETNGYARRVPGGAFFVLTPLALSMISPSSAAGRLVSCAIEPVVEAGDRLGYVVALSIPHGRGLMYCAVSRCFTAVGISPGLRRPWPDFAGAALPPEVALPLYIDGAAVACLSVHATSPLIEAEMVSVRSHLEGLAQQVAQDFGQLVVPATPFSWRRDAAAAVASALVH